MFSFRTFKTQTGVLAQRLRKLDRHHFLPSCRIEQPSVQQLPYVCRRQHEKSASHIKPLWPLVPSVHGLKWTKFGSLDLR